MGGIQITEPVFGWSRYTLPQISHEPEKIVCSGSIPHLNLHGCGCKLNPYTAEKVRKGQRLLPVCLSCEAKWKENLPKERERIRRAIHYLRPRGVKPPGSGRKKKPPEEKGEK
jgi:hypothetical protein